jgi:hypothetical protein
MRSVSGVRNLIATADDAERSDEEEAE